MELKYSEPKKIPYIDFGDNDTKLIFSVLTEDESKGFKFLCFSGLSTLTISTSAAKSKRKKTFTTVIRENFITDINFGNVPKSLKGKDKVFSPVTLRYLKELFEEFTIDGYFPRYNLEKLKSRFLNDLKEDPNDYIDDDPTATESFDEISGNSMKVKLGKGRKKGKTVIKPKPKVSLKIRK